MFQETTVSDDKRLRGREHLITAISKVVTRHIDASALSVKYLFLRDSMAWKKHNYKMQADNMK